MSETLSGGLNRYPELQANSARVNKELDGMERVWKAAGKRPYGKAVGIED
jgi:hypothetical protein